MTALAAGQRDTNNKTNDGDSLEDGIRIFSGNGDQLHQNSIMSQHLTLIAACLPAPLFWPHSTAPDGCPQPAGSAGSGPSAGPGLPVAAINTLPGRPAHRRLTVSRQVR